MGRATQMRKARHIDISSRLEITKQHGLLADYRIEWPGQSLRAPRITVIGRNEFPATVTRNYVAILLAHLVPSREIVVTRNS